MDRRNFIKSGAMATGTLMMPFSCNNPRRVRLAILGTGSWGTSVILRSALASDEFDIVALCDVNSLALNDASEIVEKAVGKKPALFSSYAELYQMSGLDAVAIATPTHWHALQFIDACKSNLHVFLEKPICYDIREGQAMLEAHQRAGNIVQVDFPRVKGKVNAEIRSFIASGEVGKIRQVHANIHHHEGALQEKSVPKSFDFEAFCGPAPAHRFLCDEQAEIPMWRGQHAFSRGILFDWGIHYIHNARKVLGLDLPESVSAFGGITRNFSMDNTDHLDVQYDFGGLPVTWSSKTWGYTSPDPDRNYGIYYYGEKATIFAGDMGWEVFGLDGKPSVIHGDVRFDPGRPALWQQYLLMTADLLGEFANQIRKGSGNGITNTLDDAFTTTAAVIFADIAYLTGSNLKIDPTTMDILNNPQGQEMLKRTYQPPYTHPYTKV